MDGGFLIETVVKPSSIPNAGRGRFFINNHKKDTIIRKQIIGSDNLHCIKNKEGLDKYDIDFLKHFGHTKPKHSEIETNYVYLNNPSMNTNHSLNNNIDYIYTNCEKITRLTRDVKAGEEMLQNYCNFTKNEWFEDFLHKADMISARELGEHIST